MVEPGNIKPSSLAYYGRRVNPFFSTKIPCLAMASSSFSSGKSEDKAFGSTSVDCSFQNMTNFKQQRETIITYTYILYMIYTYIYIIWLPYKLNIYIYNQTSYSIFAHGYPHLKNVHSIYYDINKWSVIYAIPLLYTLTDDFPLLLSVSFGWISSFTRHLQAL